jgi:hypothetical protein
MRRKVSLQLVSAGTFAANAITSALCIMMLRFRIYRDLKITTIHNGDDETEMSEAVTDDSKGIVMDSGGGTNTISGLVLQP